MAKPKPKSKARKVGRDELGAGLKKLFNREEEHGSSEQPPSEELVQELANTIIEVPLDHIETNPQQPRKFFDEEGLFELAESIKVHGIIQPITVRYLGPEQFQLISGERRWRASKKALLDSIPAYVRLADDQEMMEMALIENIQRRDLNPLEVAVTYIRLIEEFDLNHAELAKRVGKNRSTITNTLRLVKLADRVKRALLDDRISMGHARALVGLKDIDQQLYWLDRILEDKLSVRALEAQLKQHGRSRPKKPALTNEYQDVQQRFKEFFGSGNLQIKLKGEDKGQIVIPFDSVDDLNRLLDRIDD